MKSPVSSPQATVPDATDIQLDHPGEHRADSADLAGHLVLALNQDPDLLDSLDQVLSGRNYRVKSFSSAADLFAFGPPCVPACLILDTHLGGGMDGIRVHQQIIRLGWAVSTLFLIADWDLRAVVQAVRNGADGFVRKPFEPSELFDAVASALERARVIYQENLEAMQVRGKADRLSCREREIVRLVCAGMLNKEIADSLGLALVTVKVHRGRAMRKLGAGNPAELARIANMAGMLH